MRFRYTMSEPTIHSGFQKYIELKLFLTKQQIVDEELIQSGFRMPFWLLTIWLDKLIILKNKLCSITTKHGRRCIPNSKL